MGVHKTDKGETFYKQYSYFGLMLYPYENERDAFVLNYILSNKSLFPKVMYIDHDRDIEVKCHIDGKGQLRKRGDPKKPHTHVLFKWCKKGTAVSIMKHFAGDINHVEEIENEVSMANYLLHTTYECMLWGKPIYDICELKGDKDFISKIFIQNTNTAKFLKVLKVLKNFRSLSDVFEYFEKIGDDESLEITLKYGYLLLSIQNQNLKNIKEDYDIYNLKKRLYVSLGE